jgi:Xaa-Pro aminopeptidase
MENFFKQTRQRLYTLMENNSLFFLYSAEKKWRNGDLYYPFRQDSNFFYLTGIEQFNSIFLLFKSEKGDIQEFLFLYQPLQKEIIYDNNFLSHNEARKISGIETIASIDYFERQWKDLMDKSPIVYIAPITPPYQHHLFLNGTHQLLKKRYPTTTIKNSLLLIEKLRLKKLNHELMFIKESINITKKALETITKFIKPGESERNITAQLLYQYQRHPHTSYSFDPIVATGGNACILHYSRQTDNLKNGDLVLIDTGAEYFNYASDITRIFPVNGVFSENQKKIYNTVLSIQEKAIQLFVPGTTINAINKQVNKWMFQALIDLGIIKKNTSYDNALLKKYYPHGVTHFMGLDVHDTGTNNIPLEEGMVLTCEPGLYIKDLNIGIRIEDDILVTSQKPVILSANIPKTIEDIEKMFVNH